VSVTVVVSGAPGGALDRTLFSLACQAHGALEVRVGQEALGALERYRRLAPHIGWDVARSGEVGNGPYVAFFAAGELAYPAHFERLVTALETSTAGWAMARARWAIIDDAVVGEPYFRSKQDVGMDVPTPLLRAGQFALCAALFHRERLEVPDWTRGAPAQAKLLRLALTNPPIALSGLATCETPVEALPLPVRARGAIKQRLPGVYGVLKAAVRRRG
jgi:hypothetical protein